MEEIEAAIKRHQQDSRLERVLSCSSERAVPELENFLSVLTRCRLLGRLYSGADVAFSVIVKKSSPEEQCLVKGFLQQEELFSAEIYSYKVVFEEMEKLMMKEPVQLELLWPRCYSASLADLTIIMEDLKESGFVMVDKRRGLDEAHARLAVVGMARLHALSRVLIHRGVLEPSSRSASAYSRKLPFFRHFFSNALLTLADHISQEWPPKWKGVAESIRGMADTFEETLARLSEETQGQWTVFNMGDCWSNNILFKYHDLCDVPVSVRFVDFQVAHFNSFAWDLTNLVYMNLRAGARTRLYDGLLATYRDEFARTVASVGGPDHLAPSLRDVGRAMERLLLPAFLFSSFSLLSITSSNPIDYDNGTLSFFNRHWIRDNISHVRHNIKYFVSKRFIT